MNLHSDYPFWLIKEGVLGHFPSLSRDLSTDVLIIGGGISGALIGHKLVQHGIATAIVDKRHIGFGSTSASTALLQYEIDNPLHKLSALIGDRQAARAYHLCEEAIDELAAHCDKLPDRAEFERHPSLWYASYKKDVAGLLEPEFRARKRHGFRVRLLGERDLRATFGLSAPGAILSAVGATCHPYKLTSSLMNAITRQGGLVHDLTEITRWSATRNQVVLDTKRGPRIKAKYVVVAAGYESQDYLPKNVTRFHSTYAIVSKPVSKRVMWYRNSLLWETKSPYLYLRTTVDGRVLVGGRDENFQSAGKRDALIGRKSAELQLDFEKLFPRIRFEIDFAWAGTFGETVDGLPYIGNPCESRVFYAMGYGGNGITFSIIAANLIVDAILKRRNPDAEIFSFNR
jgi:glycine/D-amino acid oxidase-like deaminating enzyme